jgi:hypothetical protein
MNPGKFVLAKDGVKGAQFSHLFTDEAIQVSTPVQLSTEYDIYVSINTPNGGSYVSVTDTAALSTVGKYIDGEYTTIIRKDEYIGATVEINVCPLGELPSA